MKIRFSRRVGFVIGFALIAFVMTIGYVRAASVVVSIKNNSGQEIQSVLAEYNGGVADFGLLKIEESKEMKIRPAGESHIELNIQSVGGPIERRMVDTYFEAGYRGKIQIILSQDFEVSVTTELHP